MALQPVMPEPMTAKSVFCGSDCDCADARGCSGTCQDDTVGLGRGSPGSVAIAFEMFDKNLVVAVSSRRSVVGHIS